MQLVFFTFTYLNIFLPSQYCHFIIIHPLIHFHYFLDKNNFISELLLNAIMRLYFYDSIKVEKSFDLIFLAKKRIKNILITLGVDCTIIPLHPTSNWWTHFEMQTLDF